MVAALLLDQEMTDTDFFKDFHGAQVLKDIAEPQYSAAECEYERLCNVFKYTEDVNIAKGLIYLNYLNDVVKKQLTARNTDEIALSDTVYKVLIGVIKNYTEDQALENINERLPSNFYEKKKNHSISVNYDPRQEFKPVDPMFYIPLREDFPELDNLEKQKTNNLSFLYVHPKKSTTDDVPSNEAYPLQTMFECYKDVIPHYDYREFKAIIHTELNSNRSNDELMEYFLETFGYAAFDFLTEIIKHRNQKIEYSSVLNENDGRLNKKHPADMIAGQVTVQSEKENLLSKKLRKMEKKDKSKYSTMEIKQTEAEYAVAKTTPIFKKSAPQKLDPEEYPHVHDQLRNHMITSYIFGNVKRFRGKFLAGESLFLELDTINFSKINHARKKIAR
ncbi:hypothetical protein NQ315_000070 [Exocentrus adspersus]|uniref:Uncharacterized protein n=1 Tax=Exocentrus adspersus TaxID=1586481 RepID=A0AAV8VUC2_9CUCU|nr:hypothetical protein NQ315_000070 [Exocentrus adspersus]